MREYKDIQKTTTILKFVTCDKCKKVVAFTENQEDELDFHEWLHIHFIGGYYSIFGDGNEFEGDFCQQCTQELLGKYLQFLGNTI
jgi:hypothetical protein